MEKKFNEATPLRPEGDRPLDGPLVTIPLPSFMKQIKEEETWHNSDRNAITVFKSGDMRIVLIALHGGVEMATHKAEGMLSVQVMEGRIRFNADNQSVLLTKGELLTLHKGIFHSVTAMEEAVFLLTLATSRQEK